MICNTSNKMAALDRGEAAGVIGSIERTAAVICWQMAICSQR